jgi:hypothetical protein
MQPTAAAAVLAILLLGKVTTNTTVIPSIKATLPHSAPKSNHSSISHFKNRTISLSQEGINAQEQVPNSLCIAACSIAVPHSKIY